MQKPFPFVSFYDNVRAQHELVTRHLGIKHLHAVLGWSMGAGQVRCTPNFSPNSRTYNTIQTYQYVGYRGDIFLVQTLSSSKTANEDTA